MAHRALRGWRSTCVCVFVLTIPRLAAAQPSDIVLYGSDAEAVHGDWTLVPDATAAGGHMLASADHGWSTASAPLAAPGDYVDFSLPADPSTPYRLWLRMRGTGNSKWNESVWVQFSGATDVGGSPLYPIGTTSGLLVNLEPCKNCGVSGWGWQDGAYWLAQSSIIRFAGASHVLRVQTREDGVQVDQVVLSPVAYVGSAPGAGSNDTTIVPKASAGPSTDSISVPAGGDLQAALDRARPGETILLQPGAVYTGTFTLDDKAGDEPITVRTAPSAGLPGAGGRIAPANAPSLAKIRSGTSQPAIQTAPGAHHWTLMLLELQANASGLGEILRLGDATSAQSTLSGIPHDLVIDRVYIHGDASAGQKRAIALNSASTVITGSYIADIRAAGQDSQAICGWNGPGPYVIANNYLEAASENILFGGADPSVPNLVPANITIADNYLTKPLAWRRQNWNVKNLLELKNARHVSVVRNVFENNWQAGQTGYAVLFTPRNQGGGCPWCQVDHVRFEQNVVRHSGAGFQILGYDYNHVSRQTTAISIRDNLLYDVDPWNWGGNGFFLTLTGGAKDVAIDHNTIVQNHASGLVQLDGAAIYGFSFTNNVSLHSSYGFIGTSHGVGNDSIAAYLPGADITRNVLAGGVAGRYPADNLFPSVAELQSQFVSYTGGDYRLAAGSAWRDAGKDGRDLGQAPSIPGTVEAERFDEGGEGVAYHDTTLGNSGGAFWPADVDLEPASEGGYDVGWIAPGEWLRYSVNVAAAETYRFDARVAALGPGGTFHLEAAGRDVSGPLTIPATGGWQRWATVSTSVALDAGPQVLRVVFDASGTGSVGNLNWIRLSLSNESRGSGGGPGIGTPIPGVLQAVDYDTGGEGVGYHDVSSGNSGGAYRADNVDIERSSLGGFDVGWIADGEWLAFTVNVAAPGTYRVQVRVASPSANGRMHAVLGGRSTAAVSVPNTGGWQAWTTVTLTAPAPTAGPQVLRLVFDAGGFNVADFSVGP